MKLLSKNPPSKFKGKTALVRVDFNIAHATDTFRIQAVLPTIQFLIKAEATIILISHRGRPKTKKDHPALSLRIALPYLRRSLQRNITFLPRLNCDDIQKAIIRVKPGSVFLLENIRFSNNEAENKPVFVRSLAQLAHVYVNDAFAASHRNHASITQLPRFLPSFLGIRFEHELRALKHATRGRKRLVFILGGAKVKDKIAVIERFEKRAYAFLVGGMIANTFLKARGFDIKRSPYVETQVKIAKRLLRNKKIILPKDFIQHKNQFLDVGPLSVQMFIEILHKTQTIIWTGPLGIFEDPRFRTGSKTLAKMLSSAHAYTFIGGGETAELIRFLKLEEKMNFISTGGGAMLEYLAGKTLPGLKALQKNEINALL
jgi:phosphoglycerate kinase